MSASIEFNRSFKSIAVHQDGEALWLEPLEFGITWEMVNNADSSVTAEEYERTQNQSINKLIFFINNYLENAIWCTPESMIDLLMLIADGEKNSLMLTPQIIGGQLCCALFSKFNSIVDDMVHVVSVKLHDKQNDFSYNYNSFDVDTPELPSDTSWIGDHVLHSDPWWYRGDCSTGEIVADTSENLQDIAKEKAFIDKLLMSSFEEIDEMFREPRDHSAEVIDINRAAEKKWKPETV